MASLCEAKGNKENKETQNEMFLAFQNLIDFYCPSFLIERKKNKKTLFAIGTLLGVQKEKKKEHKRVRHSFSTQQNEQWRHKGNAQRHKDIHRAGALLWFRGHKAREKQKVSWDREQKCVDPDVRDIIFQSGDPAPSVHAMPCHPLINIAVECHWGKKVRTDNINAKNKLPGEAHSPAHWSKSLAPTRTCMTVGGRDRCVWRMCVCVSPSVLCPSYCLTWFFLAHLLEQ